MRSMSLSRVGADRNRTHVVATAYSQRPVSGTATRGGGAGLGGAGLTGAGFGGARLGSAGFAAVAGVC